MGRSPRRDHCNTGEDLRAVDSPKHRATNWLTTVTDRNHKKRPPILKSGHRRDATLRAMDARKSSSLRDRSIEATGTMMNGDCRTNSFRRKRTTTGHQATTIFSTRKRRLDKPGPDREGILRQPGTALQDHLAQGQRSRRASPYVGNNIVVRARGGGESLNRMR